MTAGSFDPVAARREVPLNRALALELVREQFPELNATHAVHLGSGWDNDAFLVDDQWVLRFPKRSSVEPWLRREIRLMHVLVERLTLRIPSFELEGKPSERFPLPFVGYRVLPGVGADQVPVFDEEQAIDALAQAFSELHGTPADAVAGLEIPGEQEGPAVWRDELCELADVCRAELPVELREASEPYLQGEVEMPPAYVDEPALLHCDICPDHILADPKSGRVIGLIDFADATWGDPAVDFTGLWMWRGETFTRRVLDRYTMLRDGGFMDRLRFLTRTLALMYLAEARAEAMGPDNLAKHRAWVRRALGL